MLHVPFSSHNTFRLFTVLSHGRKVSSKRQQLIIQTEYSRDAIEMQVGGASAARVSSFDGAKVQRQAGSGVVVQRVRPAAAWYNAMYAEG